MAHAPSAAPDCPRARGDSRALTRSDISHLLAMICAASGILNGQGRQGIESLGLDL